MVGVGVSVGVNEGGGVGVIVAVRVAEGEAVRLGAEVSDGLAVGAGAVAVTCCGGFVTRGWAPPEACSPTPTSQQHTQQPGGRGTLASSIIEHDANLFKSSRSPSKTRRAVARPVRFP